jgi:hypothetical protein
MTAWSEFRIARAISRQTLQRKCIVLVDRCNWTGHECDVLGVTMDLRIIDVEVKISRTDLKADAKKDKWWHREIWRFGQPEPERTARQHPPKVWKHYYALPAEIWSDSLFEFLPSPASGVLVVSEQRGTDTLAVRCMRRATPCRDADRLTPAQAVDIARLANLRMWEAYERQERAAA